MSYDDHPLYESVDLDLEDLEERRERVKNLRKEVEQEVEEELGICVDLTRERDRDMALDMARDYEKSELVDDLALICMYREIVGL